MNEISPSAVLNRIADSLVVEARFASKEDAVRERVLRYRRRIGRLERKHGVDFTGFTHQIEASATQQQEDDWLAWRSAIDMLNEWQAIYHDLAANNRTAPFGR